MNEQARKKTEALAERMIDAENICVLTGAGASKESGVPTFRDKDGLWKQYRPEELATVEAFLSDPELVWEWYQWRRDLIAEVKPNPGHYALAALEQLFQNFVIITQNVDGLHRNAGSEEVLEIHGNIQLTKCFDCGTLNVPDIEYRGELPKCPECGNGRLRPDVVWFGEMLPEKVLSKAVDSIKNCDIFISIGTSSIVYPAAALPQQAKSCGALLAEVNPVATNLSESADIVIEAMSGEALPLLLEHYNHLKSSKA